MLLTRTLPLIALVTLAATAQGPQIKLHGKVWRTDFDKAQRLAEQKDRPMVWLRLLGRLDGGA